MRYLLVLVLVLLCSGLGPAQKAQGQQTSNQIGRKIVKKQTPEYPELARRMNLGGIVKVVAVVATDGDVKSVEPKGGSPILLKAAEDAVSKWKFAAGGESKEVIEVHFTP
jgi:TonB family protein